LVNRLGHSLAVAVFLALTGCSGGSSGLTTGSLFGSSEAKPVTDERTERALQVAATSARATKCGYNFDPAKLRQAYLTYETAQGATPEQLAKVERAYDYTRTSISEKIGKAEDFCSEEKTKIIKADLTRHLTGDFSAPKKTEVAVPSGWWTNPSNAEPLDREKIFDPLSRRGSTY
jgi:hypothetical protein